MLNLEWRMWEFGVQYAGGGPGILNSQFHIQHS